MSEVKSLIKELAELRSQLQTINNRINEIHQELNIQQKPKRTLETLEAAKAIAQSDPVPLPIPKTPDIPSYEMAHFEWWYHWREPLTSKPNVKTRAGLLKAVYGKKEGRTTSRVFPAIGGSLGDRVSHILSILKNQ